MKPKWPLVSAIIPTHNRAGLLPRAVDSVIVQSYPNIELIIVDDGSMDDTPEIVKKYKKQYPLTYIQNENSVGAPVARNKGIKAAKGQFIAGLDDDDEWHKDRISTLLSAYSDDYACITSDTKMIYSKGAAVWKKKDIININTLLFTNQVGNQVLVKRERLVEVGGFDETLPAAQDYDLWIRLCAEYGPIKNVQKPLQNIYLDHRKGSITEQSSFKGYLQFYKKHKHRMNAEQRKYQLYKIRRAQSKKESMNEFIRLVPAWRYSTEIKRIIANRFWR